MPDRLRPAADRSHHQREDLMTTRARSREELTETAADAAIEQACRILRLPTIRGRFADIAATASRQQASYKAFLVELLAVECEDREARRRARLVGQAGFPRPKRLEDFDFAANPNVPAALIHTLGKGAWVAQGQPLCLIGDSGTGKSHLLIGLGTAAAEAGYRVRYTTTAALGYLELDRRGAELLFQVFTEREEKASIAVASNAAFSEWARTFTDPRLCAAIVDRLTFDAHIIETGTDSYRLKTTRQRRQKAA